MLFAAAAGDASITVRRFLNFSAGKKLRSNPDNAANGSWSHLGEAPKGRRVRVTGFELPAGKMHRLLEMGFVPGTVIDVIRFAPLGDPIEVRVQGYHLSLRRAEARGVLVEAAA